MPDPDAIDRAARTPVSGALSDLFLDTNLCYAPEWASGPPAIEYVARTLAASPYTVEELREIELWEVAPVVKPVPGDVAPPWCDFPLEMLAKHCGRRAARRSWFLRQRVRFGYDREVREFTQHYWDYLVPRIAELRAEAPPR